MVGLDCYCVCVITSYSTLQQGFGGGCVCVCASVCVCACVDVCVCVCVRVGTKRKGMYTHVRCLDNSNEEDANSAITVEPLNAIVCTDSNFNYSPLHQV